MEPNGVPQPTIGRIVIYRSRTGDYDVPAIVNATQETLNRKGVEAGYVPDLSGAMHVHLTVFTPGIPGSAGHSIETADFKMTGPQPPAQNQGGSYPEWDIPLNDPASGDVAPGTWRWPVRG